MKLGCSLPAVFLAAVIPFSWMASADDSDHQLLLSPTKERLLMRDVLARLEDYYQWARPVVAAEEEEEPGESGDEVVVELIPASDA